METLAPNPLKTLMFNGTFPTEYTSEETDAADYSLKAQCVLFSSI